MMISSLSQRILFGFAKWSKPKPKPNRERQQKKSFAVSDDKAAKLSKSQQQLQNKAKYMQQSRIQEQTERKLKLFSRHDAALQEYMSKEQKNLIYSKQMLYLKGVSVKKSPIRTKKQYREGEDFEGHLPNQTTMLDPKTDMYKHTPNKFGNYAKKINQKFTLSEFEGDQTLRRVGALGVKLGMTTLWDRWGHVVPVTIIELDRTQIVQIKQPVRNNTLYQVQIGFGQKNLKKITKPQLGHFLKARVPPKKQLWQFRVSKQCLLPIGYMITPRHYTPGMYVDVIGKTVGHGFQGTIKKYGFRRQPQTHGNSLTTRVLGSTGGRQDPGRVFKQKKMYGQMGNKIDVQAGLPVFKIDVDRNLLYIKGSVSGKAGTTVRIRDTILYHKNVKNQSLVHYPTFVEQEGEKYAKQISMYCGERDPAEIQIHDNAYIVDDGQEMDSSAPKQTIPED